MTDKLDDVLRHAYDALYADDLDGARKRLDEARQLDSQARDVLLLEVDLLDAEGAGEEAVAACEEALKRHEGDLVLLHTWATLLLDIYDDVNEALPALEEVWQRMAEGEKPDLKIVAGEDGDEAQDREEAIVDFALDVALTLVDCRAAAGDPEGSLEVADAAVKLDGEDAHARLARATALFELCRVDEAKKALALALDRDPRMPDAFWVRGRILTFEKDESGAKKAFERACALDPERFHTPLEISEDALAAQMEEILDELPAKVRDHLENVVIAIEDVPSVDRLTAADPPQSPGIVGFYEPGAPTSVHDEPRFHRAPDQVTLFRKNLEVVARDEADLREQIAITLLHELGHYLGLDEDDLYERGLD